MLNKKEVQIIQVLIKDKDRFVTSRDLAKQLSCSDRTIRTYYKSLLDQLKAYPGLDIVSKQGHGYRLVVENETIFTQFLSDNNINDDFINLGKNLDIEDRYNYLLNKLLFEQNEIYFDDLADELFVSRSTLSNDFRKIRKEFRPYNLTVESKANKGVYVVGSERDKRRFIMNYFIRSGFMTTMHSYVDNDLLNLRIPFEELTIIVLDECREGQLKLSDFVIQNLVIHIALAIRRVAQGFQISKINNEIDFSDLPERKVALKIVNRVTQVTGTKFPPEEVDYITLHLISKSYGEPSIQVSKDLLDSIRQELLGLIQKESPEFSQDFQLVEGLLTHLSTLIIRLESRVTLENPMSNEIQEKYRDMYVLAENVMSNVTYFNPYNLSRDEIAYIALHFMAARERLKEKNKYNILVICATGFGSAQMLKSRIENELGSIVHIADVIGYYDINDDKLKGIDFIVSSIDLSNLIFSIPVFTVSVFLTEDEIGRIKSSISHLRKTSAHSAKTNPKLDYSKAFDDYFKENAFFILPRMKKEELLEKLVASISTDENEQFEERMLELIAQREHMSSVVFSDTIAVPHPAKAVGNNHRIAVAIVPDGMYWDDNFQEIKIIFLTSMSVYENDDLPSIASSIVDLADNTKLQGKMLASQTFDDFKNLFLKINER